jgi:hypothetical protein
MANKYLELKNKMQKEVDNFPMVFAFSNEQFKEAMEKLGLTENDTDKIYSIGGGGYIRKTDSEAFGELIERHEKEMQAEIDKDETGEGFIKDMFYYELCNHEYSYTRDTESTLDALDLTIQEVRASEKLSHGLQLAKELALEDE